MQTRFKYELRKKQLKENNVNVLVSCVNGIPSVVNGSVDTTWYDFTGDIEHKAQFTFNFNDSPQQVSKEKGTSSTVILSGAAVEFVQTWLNDNPCSYLNTVEVRITDLICGYILPLYEMKSDTLKYCIGDGCKLELPMREINIPYSCIYLTSIYDNHQNYFNQLGTSTKDFPTFQVCVDSGISFLKSPRLAINILITTFPTGINFILPNESDDKARRILGLDNFYSAPLVYDILKNACDKCGMTLNTMFNPGKQYDKVCYYHPVAGVYHKNDDNSMQSPSAKFIWENRTVKAMDTFLDELCVAYNALWWVENGVLQMQFINDLRELPLAIDFVNFPYKPYDICYEYNGEKYPASGEYTFVADPKDAASNEALRRYNDRVSYTKGVTNTIFEGIKKKNTSFGATAFFCDNSTPKENYVEAAFDEARTIGLVLIGLLAIVIASLVAGTVTAVGAALLITIVAVWVISFNDKINSLKNQLGCNFYSGNIRHMGSGELDTPRLIMWDGVSLNQAKVKRQTPVIDPYYNLNGIQYVNEYGEANPANYDLMFDANFQNNLYAKHQFTDDTFLNGYTNSTVTYKVPYCCEVLAIFEIFEGGTKRLYFNARLPKYRNWESIHHITRIDLKPVEGYIEITGKLLRK